MLLGTGFMITPFPLLLLSILLFLVGTEIRPEDISPGDLLFFSTVAEGPSHVGIAIGGDQFVHAPSATGVVRVERLGTSYWSTRYITARRITPP